MDNQDNLKTCNKCKKTKNIEYFSLCLKTKKYKNICKQCNAEKARIWRQNNKEKVKISKNKHAIKHKQKIAEGQKKETINGTKLINIKLACIDIL